jgi:hypothetical protein
MPSHDHYLTTILPHLHKVPLSKIQSPQADPDSPTVKLLANMLSEMGEFPQTWAVFLTIILPDAMCSILDGHHRLAASKQAKLSHVWAVVARPLGYGGSVHPWLQCCCSECSGVPL